MTKAVLVGVGVAALAVTSGNQARRQQRQQKLNSKYPTPSKTQLASPTPIQSSEMYHDETAALAASISSYAYGRPMPGYMT